MTTETYNIVTKKIMIKPGVQLVMNFVEWAGFFFPISGAFAPDLDEVEKLDNKLDRFEHFDRIQLRIERGR